MKYVIARNAGNRPTLQHAATGYRSNNAVCGQDLTTWTRVWSDAPLGALLCMKCARILAQQELPTNVTPIRRRKTG